MTLCGHCKALDIRDLFLYSLEKGVGWDARKPYCTSVFTIRDGSEAGCELCDLIWRLFMRQAVEERELYYWNGPKGPVTDEQLRERYGTLLWAVNAPGSVRIWSPEREYDSVSNTVANLVVTREAG